jgi:hypothetical protein
MHVHVNALMAINVFLMVLILGFFWRVLSHKIGGDLGGAMAFIY